MATEVPPPDFDISSRSEYFLGLGPELAEASPGFEPVLSDPIDITTAKEYRVEVSLPPGIATSDVGIISPGDSPKYFQTDRITLEPERVGNDGRAFVVVTVSLVAEPYDDYRVWLEPTIDDPSLLGSDNPQVSEGG